MAHQSGYDGTVTMGTSGDTEFSPSQTTTVALESWTLRQTVDSFTAMAKGDAWKTKFMTAADWTATITFLVEAAMASTELDIRKAATGPKVMTALKLSVNTNDYFQGTGYVSRVEIDDPIDGPVRATVEVEGGKDGDTGAITSTGA